MKQGVVRAITAVYAVVLPFALAFSPVTFTTTRTGLATSSLPSLQQQQATSLTAIADSPIGIDRKILSRLDREFMEAARKREKLEKQLETVQTKLLEESSRLEALEYERQQYLDGATLGAVPHERTFSETAARSAVKAFAWRIIAGSVTFVTALRFSGSMGAALKIVGSDFFSKSFTMFAGERLMNKSKAGRKGGADGIGRSLAKALLWRLFAIANTLTMAIFIAKDLSVASKIAGSDAIVKTAMMFVYERSWAKVEWGKEYQVDFTI